MSTQVHKTETPEEIRTAIIAIAATLDPPQTSVRPDAALGPESWFPNLYDEYPGLYRPVLMASFRVTGTPKAAADDYVAHMRHYVFVIYYIDPETDEWSIHAAHRNLYRARQHYDRLGGRDWLRVMDRCDAEGRPHPEPILYDLNVENVHYWTAETDPAGYDTDPEAAVTAYLAKVRRGEAAFC